MSYEDRQRRKKAKQNKKEKNIKEEPKQDENV